MRILVAGGAGYIGSVTVEHLIEDGHEIVVIDNLSRGHEKAVHPAAKLHKIDLADLPAIDSVFKQYEFDGVMHFCASSLVGESVVKPLEYYSNNICGGLNLVNAMVTNGVGNLVFSSTAAIFGEPESQPITEDAPHVPLNPYGRTKLCFEHLLRDVEAAHGLKSTCLRYFNAAGATTQRGEDHRPETHLIPLIMDAARGKRESISVFGDDYPTVDGTCVRDYIHVSDLAQAHILAITHLVNNPAAAGDAFNLGNGMGFSVRDVINSVQNVTGFTVTAMVAPRRAGDPAVLVASSDKIRNALGWNPNYANLDSIVESAWHWVQKNPDGYKNS